MSAQVNQKIIQADVNVETTADSNEEKFAKFNWTAKYHKARKHLQDDEFDLACKAYENVLNIFDQFDVKQILPTKEFINYSMILSEYSQTLLIFAERIEDAKRKGRKLKNTTNFDTPKEMYFQAYRSQMESIVFEKKAEETDSGEKRSASQKLASRQIVIQNLASIESKMNKIDEAFEHAKEMVALYGKRLEQEEIDEKDENVKLAESEKMTTEDAFRMLSVLLGLCRDFMKESHHRLHVSKAYDCASLGLEVLSVVDSESKQDDKDMEKFKKDFESIHEMCARNVPSVSKCLNPSCPSSSSLNDIQITYRCMFCGKILYCSKACCQADHKRHKKEHLKTSN